MECAIQIIGRNLEGRIDIESDAFGKITKDLIWIFLQLWSGQLFLFEVHLPLERNANTSLKWFQVFANDKHCYLLFSIHCDFAFVITYEANKDKFELDAIGYKNINKLHETAVTFVGWSHDYVYNTFFPPIVALSMNATSGHKVRPI